MITGVLVRPLQLLALGQFRAVYFECYAELERDALNKLPLALTEKKSAQCLLATLVERRTLSEVAESLSTLGLWDSQCVKFIRLISRIRNGIAHNNEKLIQKSLGELPTTSPFVLKGRDPRFKLEDTANLLLDTIDLCLRLHSTLPKRGWRKLSSKLNN
jgi:hypothetical protein